VKVYVSFFSIFALLLMLPLVNQFALDLNLRVGLSLFFVFLIGMPTHFHLFLFVLFVCLFGFDLLPIALTPGMCIATLIGTGFGLIAPLPPVYITALMTGQGLAGVFAGMTVFASLSIFFLSFFHF
jgi:hypothetical protein